MSLRVLVVDDHAVVRSGLCRVLDAEPDMETVGKRMSFPLFSARTRLALRSADGS